MEKYPYLEPEDIRQVLLYAAWLTEAWLTEKRAIPIQNPHRKSFIPNENFKLIKSSLCPTELCGIHPPKNPNNRQITHFLL